MSNVVNLPTRATSYYTVRRAGKTWAVQLVTPCPGRPICTIVARFSSRAEAFAYGGDTAARLHRPFRCRKHKRPGQRVKGGGDA